MNFAPLRDFLDNYVGILGIPGSDTVIYRDHEPIFRHTSGYDDIFFGTPTRDNALYNMYSITKLSLATAAMQLIERGEILINDPVHVYFPEYKNLQVARRGADGKIRLEKARNPILIRHLFCHLSRRYKNTKNIAIRIAKHQWYRCFVSIRVMPNIFTQSNLFSHN